MMTAFYIFAGIELLGALVYLTVFGWDGEGGE